MKVAVTLCILLMVVTSCASSGRRFDERRVDDIVDGTTTRRQIVEWFGSPFSQTETTPEQLEATGIALTYVYVHATSRMGNTASKALCVTFDRRDVVLSHAFETK